MSGQGPRRIGLDDPLADTKVASSCY